LKKIKITKNQKITETSEPAQQPNRNKNQKGKKKPRKNIAFRLRARQWAAAHTARPVSAH
jgi:hypothetical protein